MWSPRPQAKGVVCRPSSVENRVSAGIVAPSLQLGSTKGGSEAHESVKEKV